MSREDLTRGEDRTPAGVPRMGRDLRAGRTTGAHRAAESRRRQWTRRRGRPGTGRRVLRHLLAASAVAPAAVGIIAATAGGLHPENADLLSSTAATGIGVGVSATDRPAEVAALAVRQAADARAEVSWEKAVSRRAARQAQLAADLAAERAAHQWVMPIPNAIQTSPFGERWGRMHKGLDFAAPVGTPVRALSSGAVSFAGEQGGFGILVQITHWDGTVSYVGHLSAAKVTVGQPVRPGQVVALSGNTGHSTGPHLHLEVHPRGGDAVDPRPWLLARHVPLGPAPR